MNSQVVAIDVGATTINALEVLIKGKMELPVALKAASYNLPSGIIESGEIASPDELVHHLKTFWKKAGFKSNKVALMNSGLSYDTRPVNNLLTLEDSLFKTTLPSLVRDKVPYDVDEYYLDSFTLDQYYEQERGGTKQRLFQDVMVVATQRASVDSIVNVLTKAKLVPVYMDILPLCMLRAYYGELNEGVEGQPIVSLDIGSEILTIQVHTDSIPEHTHIADGFGGKNITTRIATEMGMTEQEAEILKVGIGSSPEEQAELTATVIHEDTGLVETVTYSDFTEDQIRFAKIIISKEVTTIISYINDILRDAWTNRDVEDQPYEIVLSGSSAKVYTFMDRLNSELGIPARQLDPFQHAKIRKEAEIVKENTLKYAPLYGLAIGVEDL